MSDAAGLAGLIGSLGGLAGKDGQGVLQMMTTMAAQANNYKGKPALGTGIQQIVDYTKKLGLFNEATVAILIPELPGLFGGFPSNVSTEIGPDALFIALFSIMFIANMGMFLFNVRRKHFFYLQLGLAAFCAMKVIGFATRLAWAHSPANLPRGICSVVFIQVAQLVLQGLNLVLAHRIFTWHHPQTGYHWVVNSVINLLYFLVCGIMTLAIIGQVLPYLHFLSEHHRNICLNLEKAAAVLNLVYSTLPFWFLLVTYALKPGTIIALPKVFNAKTQQKEEVMPAVYQATWVKSAGLFYYPEPNGQWQSYRGENLDDAMRIIPSRDPPKIEHRRATEETSHPLAPHLHWTTVTVIVSSLVLTMNTCFRVAACFNNKVYAKANSTNTHNVVQFWPHEPYVMFIFYGATEICVLAFYLLMRIDLRFYIPDAIRHHKNKDFENQYQNSLSETSEKNNNLAVRTNTNNTKTIEESL